MDTWNAPTVQSRQPLTYRLLESVGLGGPRWLGSSWQKGIAESGSSQLSTLTIETPGNLVWDLPQVQQASCLEGGPLLRILPLYLHVNQNSDDDDEYFLMYPNRKSVTYIKGTQHLGKTKKNVRPALTCHSNLDISPDINPALLLTGSFVRLMA